MHVTLHETQLGILPILPNFFPPSSQQGGGQILPRKPTLGSWSASAGNGSYICYGGQILSPDTLLSGVIRVIAPPSRNNKLELGVYYWREGGYSDRLFPRLKLAAWWSSELDHGVRQQLIGHLDLIIGTRTTNRMRWSCEKETMTFILATITLLTLRCRCGNNRPQASRSVI